MAIKSKSLNVNFLVWDTVNNRGKTGDANNITLKIVKDGVLETLGPNRVTETDPSGGMPGVYQVALTDTEMDADFICVSGVSTTPNVVVHPAFVQTERGDLDAILTRLNSISPTISRLSEVLPLGADVVLATKEDVEDAQTDPTLIQRIVDVMPEPGSGVVVATKEDVEDAQTNPALIQRIIAVLPEPGEGVVVATEGDVTAAKNEIIRALPGDLSELATKEDVTEVKREIEKVVTVLPTDDNVVLAASHEVENVRTDTQFIRDNGVKLNKIGKDDVAEMTTAALTELILDELTTLPAPNPTLPQAIMLPYMALRNRTTNNEDTMKLFKSDNSELATAILQDNGTVFVKNGFE